MRILRIAARSFAVLGFLWFGAGLIMFPDAPIQRCGSSYCGKQRQPHTERDFERFQIWQRGLGYGWPLVLLAMWLGSKKKPTPDEELKAVVRENARHETH